MEVLTNNELADYVCNQLAHFFPDNQNLKSTILKNVDEAMNRMLYSLKHVKLNGYTKFSHLHSDLYAQFIYYLSNTIWNNDKNVTVSSKLFYLNKVLHGINCMYDTQLPDIFLLIHCIGTVLGKASYSNYFVACHNVTIGSDKGYSPIINEGVYLGPGSSIVGKCVIGTYSHFSINSVVLNQNTKDNCVVIGSGSNFILKDLKRNLIYDQYFI